MSQVESESRNIMELLKESTAAMHDSAESSQFQALLAQGQLPVDCYADYLEQLFLIHRALEDSLTAHQESNDELRVVFTEPQRQKAFLEEDLDTLGRNTEKIKKLTSTTSIVAEIDRLLSSQPLALLGMHYVLLGSKHGGKFIAKSCQEAYQFKNGAGVRYFDPYGSNFMPIWKGFKDSMNQLHLSTEESAGMCKAAGLMFVTIGQLGNELMSAAKR